MSRKPEVRLTLMAVSRTATGVGPLPTHSECAPPGRVHRPRSTALARLALAVALLAGAALVAPDLASAQTTLWSATLSPTIHSSTRTGCNNTIGGSHRCSLASVLSDDDFTVDGTNVSITQMFDDTAAGTFSLSLVPGARNLVSNVELTVGTTTYALAASTTTSGQTYRWNTTAGLSQGTSVTVSLKKNTAPGAPTGLTATASGQTTINLSWTAPTNTGGKAITGYRIEASFDGGTTFSDLQANTGNANTTYSDTSLTVGTTRHYRVSAINSLGTGSASGVASATTETPAARTTIWSATLTVADIGVWGCGRSNPPDPTTECSNRLSDDDFSFGGTDYSIDGLSVFTNNRLVLDTNQILSGLKWTLHSGSDSFEFADGHAIGTQIEWNNSGLSWGDDDRVALAITVPAPGPSLSSGSVNGHSVTLIFAASLDSTSKPAPSAFTVTATPSGGGASTTISGASGLAIFSSNVAFDLASKVKHGDTLTLSYTKPSTNPLRSSTGAEVDSFSGTTITNNTLEVRTAPAFAATTASFSITENHAAGATVGTVSATDSDGDTVTYSLADGGDNDSFTIDSATGVIKVRTGVTLDYETKSSHSLTAQVTDGEDALGGTETTPTTDDTITVAVTVTNEEEPPGPPTGVTVTSTGPNTLEVTWTAPAHSGPPITGYTLQHRTAGGAWTSAAHGDTTTTATLGGLDPSTAYEVQVRAHGDGDGPWSQSGQGTTDAPAAAPTVPSFVRGAAVSFRIAENAPAGATVGRVVASDADGDTLTYSLAPGGDNDSFRIDNRGAIRVRPGVTLDYETRSSYALSARVSDGEDADGERESTPSIDATIAVTVTVTDVVEVAPTISGSPRVNGTRLVLVFSADLDATSVPAASAFTVSVDGSRQAPTGVAIAGAEVTLTLGTATKPGQSVTVSYTAPGASPLRDAAGSAVADFPELVVTNDTRPAGSGPTADAGDNVEVDPEERVTLDGSGSSDPDGDQLTYAWTQTAGPTVTLSDAAAAQPTFAAPWQPGALTFQLTVTDPGGLSASATVTVTVRDLAPSFAEAVADRPLERGQAIEPLVLPAAHGGNGTLTYELTSAPAGLGGLAFDTATRTLSGTPDTAGRYVFTYRAHDADANRDAADAAALTFAVTVNRPPAADAGADLEVDPEEQVMLDGSGSSDPDGDPLTFAWTQTAGAPVTLSDAATARPSFAAPWEPGAVIFQLTVTDPGGLTSSDTVAVEVRDLAPSFGTGTVPGLTLEIGRAITPLELPEANGGNGTLSYELTSEPAGLGGLAFDPAARTLSGTPQAPGRYLFTYRAHDADANRADDDSADLTFAVTVNRPPVADAGADLMVEPREQVTLDGSGSSDPDADPLTFAWTQTAGTTVTLRDPLTPKPSFTAPWQPDALTFQLTVTDPAGLSASATVTVTVRDLAPSFGTETVPNLTLERGREIEPLELPPARGGNGSLSYELTSEPAGLAGLAFDPDQRTLSGNAASGGRFTFTYRGHDADANRTAADAAVLTFEVTVVATAERRQILKPTLAAVAAQTLASALDTIGLRFAGGGAATSVTLAGRPLPLAPAAAAPGGGGAADPGYGRRGELDELLRGSAFSYAPEAAAAGASRLSLWGRGDWAAFEGRPEPGARYQGQTLSGWLGFDVHSAPWLAGLALSHGVSEADYGLAGGDAADYQSGRLELALTALYPYASWEFADGFELRGLLGAGYGSVLHEPGWDGEPREESEVSLWLASLGLRGTLLSVAGLELAARADGSVARMETAESAAALDRLRADHWRARLGLEAGWRLALGGDAALEPFVAVAGRHDGGDGVTGSGLEVAGGLRFSVWQVHLESRGRLLAAHSVEGTQEHGVSVTARLGPGPDGAGPALALTSRWGAGATPDGAQALWGHDLPRLAGSAAAAPAGIEARAGYGVVLAPDVLLTPFAEAALGGEDDRRVRLGTRFEAATAGLYLELSGERRERAAAAPADALRLDLALTF